MFKVNYFLSSVNNVAIRAELLRMFYMLPLLCMLPKGSKFQSRDDMYTFQ